MSGKFRFIERRSSLAESRQRANVGDAMTSPLIVGQDRETGEPIIVSKFAIRLDRHGRLLNTFATCEGRALQERFLAGIGETEEDRRVERIANRVVTKLRVLSPEAPQQRPERFNVEQAAAVASVSTKALRHRIQRGFVPERLIIREGRRVFFVAEAWRRFVSSNRSGRGR